MKEKYKNKEWLHNEIIAKNKTISDISKQFNKDITTVRYWCNKFKIDYAKESKYRTKKFICPVCRKDFDKKKYKKTQATYCSQECAYKGREFGYTKRIVENGYNTKPTKITLICQNCKDIFIVDKTEKERKYCSRECFLETHKQTMLGENNPSWIDGRSYEKECYRGVNWNEQRFKCYERDNYTCQICNVKCISRNDLNENNGSKIIQCHHINDFESEEDNELENLITLCASCHKKLHEGVVELEMD